MKRLDAKQTISGSSPACYQLADWPDRFANVWHYKGVSTCMMSFQLNDPLGLTYREANFFLVLSFNRRYLM